MDMNRIRMAWSGFPGAPGVSTFYVTDPVPFLNALHAAMADITTRLPLDCTVSFPGEGDIVNDVSGLITGTWTTIALAPLTGTGVGAYAGVAGAACTWLTGGVVDGHRVRGRTFLVPLASGAFDTDGTLNPTALAQIRSDMTALYGVGAGGFGIWHRPRLVTTGIGAPISTPGSFHLVTGSRVSDKAAVLRSRRD